MIRQCSRCLHVTIAIFRCFRVLVVCTFRHITIEEPAVYSSSKTLSLFQTFQFSRRYHWLHLYVTFFFFWMNHALTISCSSHLIHLPRSHTCLPPSLSSPRAHLHVVGMLGFMSDINQPSLPTHFYSVLVSISVFMALTTVFHSIKSPDNSLFSDCSSGLISALLVLSTLYLFMKVSFSPDIIPSG